MIRCVSFLFGLVLLVAGCSPRVIHFTNPSAKFGSYSTFLVVNYKANNADISAEGMAILAQIEELINGQMVRREYNVNSKNPDLLVRYEIISNQRTEVDQNSNPYYPGMMWGNSFSLRTFLESALLIEITDITTKKVVWQASVDLNKYTKSRNREELLQKAIAQIYDTYLYNAGSRQPDESLITDK